MEREERNKAIVEYIDLLINKLGSQYWDKDFSMVRSKSIEIFCNMEGTIEELQPQIESSFINMISDIDAEKAKQADNFSLTNEEQKVYETIKQENVAKREALGLNNVKKLLFKRKDKSKSNGGYISLLAVLGIVIIVVVLLTVIVCNVLL